MRKTIFMLPALALMLFAACSSEDAVTTESKAQLNETPDNAIGFGAYINRTTTRAGKPGTLKTSGANPANNEINLQDVGFGVFAYYGDGDVYNENALPNFMYNQNVTYSTGSGVWEYNPVKYWPNEFGSSAASTGVDRVSFFAYAPYVTVTPNTGQLTTTYDDLSPEKSTTTGITALSRNGKPGDPYVKYVSAYDAANCVDLCYGVAAEAYTNSVGAGDGRNNIKQGDPFLNVAKPTVDSKIKFDFKHALAKLIVAVDADVNVIAHSESGDPNVLDANTRIWVRSITFDGVAPRGYLNLKTGIWYDVMDNEKISRGSVTIHDGRRDGQEAQGADTYEIAGLNSNLVQSAAYGFATSGTELAYGAINAPSATGVTVTTQNLFGTTNGDILVIPANEQLKATIVYDVETADITLPTYLSDGVTHGSTVENKITKYITLSGGAPFKLEAGKSFTLNLHLGLNSVKFDAKVGDWDSGTNPDDTWLPSNMLILAKGETGATARSVNVPSAAISEYYFKVTGLTPGATPTTKLVETTPVGSGTPDFAPALTKVPASGEVTVKVTGINANSTVKNLTNQFIVKEGSSTVATVNIIQKFKEFKGKGTTSNGITSIEITENTGSGDVDKTLWTDATTTISIKKRLNSTSEYVDLVQVNAPPTDDSNEFSYQGDSTNGKGIVTLGTAAATDNEYLITFKIGDADADTFVVTVGL